jgi:hypothetical protein
MNKLSLSALAAVAAISAFEQSVRNDTVQDTPQHSRGRAFNYGEAGTRTPSNRQRRRTEREAMRNAKQLEALHSRSAKRSRKAAK